MMEPVAGPLPPGVIHLVLFGAGAMLTVVESLVHQALHRETFTWKNESKKFVKLAVFPVALAVDTVIAVIGWNFLGITTFGAVVRNVLPFTLLTLVYFIIWESTLILERVAEAEGQRGTAVKMLWVLRQVRVVDAVRYPGPGVPARRWWDGLTEDHIQVLLDKMRREGDITEEEALEFLVEIGRGKHG